MSEKTLKKSVSSRWFYLFLLAHYLVWTLVPIMVRCNLPLDAIEGTIWAHQLEWSYDKNPFLNGWLTALALKLDGHSGWMIYHFCQLSVVACLWSVWQISKRMLSPTYALISVMILEGVQYYNLHALDFNDNTLELGLWGVTIACFYWACKKRPTKALDPSLKHAGMTAPKTEMTARDGMWRMTAWLFTGFFAAMTLMAKYYTLALFAGMFLFLIMTPNGRQQLKTWPPYAALVLLIAIITPHIFWLIAHDFTTVRYVFMRADSEPDWANHLFFPAQFAWQMLQAFLPAVALLLCLLIGKRPALNTQRISLTLNDKAFLFYVGMGPFLLTIILSLISGIKLRAGWGMPLLSLWGIILIASVQPAITKAKLHRFITLIFLLMALMAAGYTKSLVDSDTPSSSNFPGKEIAAAVTKVWYDQYQTKLEYLAGSRWGAGNVAFHSADHPAVLIEWDNRASPWINMQDLENKGALFVWVISDDETLPIDIKQHFPRLQPTQVLEFQWLRRTHDLPPIKIGVAVLPPAIHPHL